MKVFQAREWFRAFMDSAPDVYFRYRLRPRRRFEYLSPAVKSLTNHEAEEFYADSKLCIGLIAPDDRRALRQTIRSHRARTLTVGLLRADGTAVPIEIRTIAIVRGRRIQAIEGVARQLAGDGVMSGFSRTVDGSSVGSGFSRIAVTEPTQQRLTALMYEVHDLLHRTLAPPSVAGTAVPTQSIRLGDMVFDTDRFSVTEGGHPVVLTGRELLVLRYLLLRPCRVITRRQLLTDVWDYHYTGDDRTVDVHISRLRRKLPSLRARLVAVKHVGYRLDADAAGAAAS
jgi:DNA-binding winged helix-turn-helix (wHTH) protein